MSEFVLLFRATDAGRQAAMGTPERAQQSLQTWLNWISDLEARGHLKERGQPLEPTGKVVDGRNQKKVITDGPYAEAKDILLGFIIVEAKDIDEAARLSLACPMVEGGGSVEVRPVGSLAV
jgi:hypothetical protein